MYFLNTLTIYSYFNGWSNLLGDYAKMKFISLSPHSKIIQNILYQFSVGAQEGEASCWTQTLYCSQDQVVKLSARLKWRKMNFPKTTQ